MKKWIFVCIVLVLVFVFFLLLWPDSNQNIRETLETGSITRGDLTLTISATGVVRPYKEVEVKSKAGGEIISFGLEEGDKVKKDAIVVKLDPDVEKSKVNQANADLLVAQAGLEKAKIALKDSELRLERREKLYNAKMLSRQDMDDALIAVETAQSDIKIAEGKLIRAREALKEAGDRLKDTEIRAPVSGTILKKYVEEGQVISSTISSASEGTLLFTLANLNKMYIEAQVDETDIGRIRTGQTAVITIDSYPDKKFTGHVVRIAPKGRVESTITIFDVIIEVSDDSGKLLKPLMTSNVEILTDVSRDVLLVPSEALRKKGKELGIYRLHDNKKVWTPVKEGKSNGILTEIHGNLREGDKVILSGMENTTLETDRSRNLRRGFRFFGRKK